MKLSINGVKMKRTRSKTGCLTCRKRKKKCDENKPNCNNCIHLNKECVWPNKDNNNIFITTTTKRITKPMDKDSIIKTNNRETTTLLKPIENKTQDHILKHDPAILLKALYPQQFVPSPTNQEEYGATSKNMVLLDSSIINSNSNSNLNSNSNSNSPIMKKSNYYLERIAMQQDCVEEDYLSRSSFQYIDIDTKLSHNNDNNNNNDQSKSNNSP